MDSFPTYRSVVYLCFMFYLPFVCFAGIVAGQSAYAVISKLASPFAFFVLVLFSALNCLLKLNTFVTTVGPPRSCL